MLNPLRLRLDHVVGEHLERLVPVCQDDLLVLVAILVHRDVVPVDAYLEAPFSQFFLGDPDISIQADDLGGIEEGPLEVDVDNPPLEGQLVVSQGLVDQFRKELLELIIFEQLRSALVLSAPALWIRLRIRFSGILKVLLYKELRECYPLSVSRELFRRCLPGPGFFHRIILAKYQ